jgi:hypothetical protein
MCVQCVYNVYTICVLVFGGDFEVIRYYTIRGETQVACLKFLLLTKQIKNENTTAFEKGFIHHPIKESLFVVTLL